MTAQETALNGEEKLYTTSKAAKLLGISPATLRLWEQRGFISPYRTPGGERRYTLKQLESLLRKQNDGRRKNLPYSISEAAKLLGVSPATLRLWEQRDFISPYRTPGGERRYNLKQLEGLLRNQNDGRRKENKNPPSFRTVPVRSMEHYRPTPRLHRFGRRLVVVGLALLLVSFVWARTPLLTKKRLERAFSPGPLNPIVDVNDALEYRVEDNLVTGLRAKFPFVATSVATEFLRVTTDALFKTSRFLGTLFFGDGTAHFIKPSGDASLRSLVAEKLNISGAIEAVGRFVTSLVPARNNTYDLGTRGLQWRSGYFGTSVAVGEDALLTKAQLLFTEEAAIDSEGPLNLNIINNQLITTGAGQVSFGGNVDAQGTFDVVEATTLSSTLDVTGDTSIGGELTVDGTGTHTFAGTLDPDQVVAFTLTGDITGSGSPNITNIGQFSGTSFTDGILTISGGNITGGFEASFGTKVTTPEIENTGNVTVDAINASADSTIYVLNSDGTYGANLDVEGDLSVGGGITCIDCLDFSEFADNLTLDAATDIALGALTLSTSGTGALSFASTGQVSFAGNVDAGAGLDVSGAALTSSAGLTVSAGGATISSGALAVNSGSITSTAATLVINAAGAVDIQDNLTADSLTTDTGGVSIAAAQSYTGAGAVTLSSGGANTLTIDTGGAAALNIGTTSQNALTLGRAGVNTTINGANIILGAVGDAATEAVRADRSLTFTQDTNVTITNSGVAQNLTADRSWTLGWTGLLSIARGGTNSSATPTAGAVAYGTGTAYAFTLAGNAGQPLLSGAAGTPTWGTLSVSYGGTGLSSLASGALLYGSGSSPMSTLGIGSANQLLGVVGAGGSLEYKTVSGTASEIDITHAVNSITIGIVDPLTLSKGGTEAGLTAVQGGVVYSGASALAISAAGTSGYALISGGTGAPTWTNTPSWSTLALSSTGNALTLSGAGANIAFTGAGLAQITTAASQDLALMPGGNVGIGTAGPEAKLDVNGIVRTSANMRIYRQAADVWAVGFDVYKRGTIGDATAAITSGSELGYNSFYGWDGSAYGRGGYLWIKAAENFASGSHGANLYLATTNVGSDDASVKMTVLAGGNVGIGTTGPQEMLDIVSPVSSSSGIRISSTDGSNKWNSLIKSHWSSDATAHMSFGMGSTGNAEPTEQMVIMGSTGNVGIGTTAPDFPLDVRSNSGIGIGSDTARRKTLTTSADSPWDILNITSLGKVSGWKGAINFNLSYSPAGTPGNPFTAMTIRANTDGTSGNVGIGDDTPTEATLVLNGTACKSASGDWTACSDLAIKTDIQDLENAVDIINQLRPVKFRYTDEYRAEHPTIEEDRYYYNFIAQEFQEVFPDSVKENDSCLSLDAYVVRPYLVKAIQEQHKLSLAMQEQIDHVKADLLEATSAHVAGELKSQLVEGGEISVDTEGDLAREFTVDSQQFTEKILAGEIEANQGIFQRLTAEIGEFVSLIVDSIKAKTAEIASAVIGNLTATFIKTDKIEAGEVSITEPAVGRVVVPVGEADLFVSYPEIKENSKVFLTPEEPLPIGAVIKEGEGFEIKLKEPASADITVSYWIIN